MDKDKTKAQVDKESFLVQPHEMSSIKKVIGILSGKGGVGKSAVTSMIAVQMQKKGYRCAILDADITGPSIPMAFGIRQQKVSGGDYGIFPVKSSLGIDMMSINLLLNNETDPVIWRGPILGNTVKQFWSEVIWGDIDFLFVDMPPGTGDVPLTIFQSVKIDGVIVITSPQELVSMVVAKAVKMAEKMGVKVLGLIENMSYFKCGVCGTEHRIFGESNIDRTASEHGIDILAKVPIDPMISASCDEGTIESYDNDWFEVTTRLLEGL